MKQLFILLKLFNDAELERIKHTVCELGLVSKYSDGVWVINGIDGNNEAEKIVFFDLANVAY